MAIGIQDEHEELRSAVQGWAEARGVAGVVRTALDADTDSLPPYWGDLAAQGLLAIHLDEELGGQGAGAVELAVVAEELGRGGQVYYVHNRVRSMDECRERLQKICPQARLAVVHGRMRGAEGSSVKIGIMRDGKPEPLQFTLKLYTSSSAGVGSTGASTTSEGA